MGDAATDEGAYACCGRGLFDPPAAGVAGECQYRAAVGDCGSGQRRRCGGGERHGVDGVVQVEFE